MNIQELFTEAADVASLIDTAVAVYSSEGRNGISVGSSEIPQSIEIEFNGTVPEEHRDQFEQLVRGTSWDFVDHDNVFVGENEGNGLIEFYRKIDPGDVSAFRDFDEERYF